MLAALQLVPVLLPQLRMMQPYIGAEDERRPIGTSDEGPAVIADGGDIGIRPGMSVQSQRLLPTVIR